MLNPDDLQCGKLTVRLSNVISSHLEADKSHILPLSVTLHFISLFNLNWFIYHLRIYHHDIKGQIKMSHRVH